MEAPLKLYFFTCGTELTPQEPDLLSSLLHLLCLFKGKCHLNDMCHLLVGTPYLLNCIDQLNNKVQFILLHNYFTKYDEKDNFYSILYGKNMLFFITLGPFH